jgi:hypothetical protein
MYCSEAVKAIRLEASDCGSNTAHAAFALLTAIPTTGSNFRVQPMETYWLRVS